jgi:carbon-monoxide dehydrogenase medium subunit
MTAEFVPARSLEEAFDALADEDAVPIAGGVAVGLLASLGLFSAERVVALGRIEELKGVNREGSALVLGAATTHAELAADPLLVAELPEVAAMFGHIGNVRVRCWGTVGGNLALAEPSQDPPVFLTALGAEVVLRSREGSRRVPVGEFSGGAMTTVLEPGELITGISVPLPAPGDRRAYLKFLPKTADDYATVSAAVALRFDGDRIASARIVCGAVGPTPVDCAGAAELVIGGTADEPELLHAVGEAVRTTVTPLTDHRGSADYKAEMAGVFAQRALRRAVSPTATGGNAGARRG